MTTKHQPTFESAARPKKKPKPAEIEGKELPGGSLSGIDLSLVRPVTEVQKYALSGGNAHGLELLEEILARIESLESRVGEIESRKAYMKEYMRRKRAEENRSLLQRAEKKND